jgi:hypothetical protein
VDIQWTLSYPNHRKQNPHKYTKIIERNQEKGTSYVHSSSKHAVL